MSWSSTNPYGGVDGGITGGIGNNTFTVIAFPRDTRARYLSTFAVTDDQVVRVYTDDPGVLFDSVTTWTPIL